MGFIEKIPLWQFYVTTRKINFSRFQDLFDYKDSAKSYGDIFI